MILSQVTLVQSTNSCKTSLSALPLEAHQSVAGGDSHSPRHLCVQHCHGVFQAYHYLYILQASQAARRKALQQGDGGGDASSGSSGEDPLEAYSRELIRGELTQRLFSLAQKIHKKLPEHVGRGGQNDEDSVFPVHPGSHLRLTNPALEFVKALVKVLSLDPAIEKEAAKLRRDLLRLIGVGEFGEQAEWRDPCISFVLPEVICKQCNHCRDLDLCKDPHVAEAATGAGGALAPAWTCAGADCGAPYDAVDIEHQLVDALQRKTMGFVLQDLQCRKCRGVKELNMAAVCSCAGSFATSVRHSDLTVTLRYKDYLWLSPSNQ